jgi:hypothetical protein
MPVLNEKIVTGSRGPEHSPQVGTVQKPFNPAIPETPIRKSNLLPGQVQFNSHSRLFRVQLTLPHNALDVATQQLVGQPSLFLQFVNRTCIVEDLEVIHRAQGCAADGSVDCHTHPKLKNCKPDCTGRFCKASEGRHRTVTGLPFNPHQNYGIHKDFWNAQESETAMKESRKIALIEQLKQVKDQAPPEELNEILTASGMEGFNLPPREPKQEASK